LLQWQKTKKKKKKKGDLHLGESSSVGKQAD